MLRKVVLLLKARESACRARYPSGWENRPFGKNLQNEPASANRSACYRAAVQMYGSK